MGSLRYLGSKPKVSGSRLAKIAFLLLCHKNADRVLEQARVLSAGGDYVVIHVDGNAPKSFFEQVKDGTRENANVQLAPRVKCGWGEWSLVQATLNMIDTGFEAYDDATHFMLISGDCMPIKSGQTIRETLTRHDQDMIEHADFFKDDWIKTGMKEDRLIYRHWFNERGRKNLFYASLDLQRKLGLKRDIPKDLRIRIGSQWWALRRVTIQKIREFTRARSDVMRFFRTTWIPDETFFQTLTMHLVPRTEVVSRPPTLLMFSDYGMPVTFCADHFELLKSQDALFARKISDHDDELRRRLGELFNSDETSGDVSNSGRVLYNYVRERGRAGKRFAHRIWETGARIGPDHDLTVIICKKWHVAQRLIKSINDNALCPSFGYIFDQTDAKVPDLGNVASSHEKRSRHRRAFLKLLYQHEKKSKLAICIDPSNVDAVRDFAQDGCTLRVLEIECELSPDWLIGHAERIGLGNQSDRGALNDGLLITLRQNILDEIEQLRGLKLAHHYRIHDGMEPGQMARPISDALNISVDAGAKAARTPYLFHD